MADAEEITRDMVVAMLSKSEGTVLASLFDTDNPTTAGETIGKVYGCLAGGGRRRYVTRTASCGPTLRPGWRRPVRNLSQPDHRERRSHDQEVRLASCGEREP